MRSHVLLLGSLLALWLAPQAHAIPILQLYLEGGTYDNTTESWVLTPEGSSSGAPFRIWAIGNISGPGGAGVIEDVRLSIAYDASYSGMEINLTPTRAGGVGSYNGVQDLYAPAGGTINASTSVKTSKGEVMGPEVTNGGVPLLSSGKMLPNHGEFVEGVYWQEFFLGDFTDATDATFGDFINDFPTDLVAGAQINVYDVQVTGGHGARLHFDLYDHIQTNNKAVFTPFSHDGDGGSDGDVNVVPEPVSLVAWSILGGLGLVIGSRRRRGVSAP